MNNEDTITDQEIIKRTLTDRNAYSLIVERYEASLARYIRRLGCSDSDAIKDLLQEIFIKTYLNLNDYDSSLQFSSWIYRIAHNETVSFFRKNSTRPRVAISDEELAMFEQVKDEVDIRLIVEQAHDTRILHDALARLENKYRDVLILRFLEEKSYEEISDILKIPMGTVATLVSRGKAKLKELLVEKYSSRQT